MSEAARSYRLTQETRDGTLVVRAGGKFDRDAGLAVEALLGPEIPRYVINLSQVEYISSSGIAYLVKLASSRGLRLAAPAECVRHAFGLAGIERILTLHPDEASAARADD